jgi:hypothetical protein
VLASLLGFAANMLYAAPSVQRSYDFNIGNALYDFGSTLYRDSNTTSCVTALNRQCELGMEENMSEEFSLKYVQLSYDGDVVDTGSITGCAACGGRCYMLPENGTYGEACLYVCG